MLKRGTILPLCAVFCLLATLPAWAQPAEVTVRQLNELAPDSLNTLLADGPNLPLAEIGILMRNEFFGQEVTFVGVVLSDPLVSGLATWSDTRGGPGRIHVFVRDTSAVTQGVEGMNMQVVDGDYENTGFVNALIGDVFRFTGSVNFFGQTGQFEPTTIEPLGSYTDLGLPESILDPITATTSDLNTKLDDGVVHTDWNNFLTYINQEVCFENVRIIRRQLADTGRPAWVISSDNGETFLLNDDIPLFVRNDRIGSYQAPFLVRSANDPFRPPPIGAVANVCGFVTTRSSFTPFDLTSMPLGAWMLFNVFDEGDIEITQSPPIFSGPSSPDFVPGTDPVEITADVIADPTRTLTEVVLKYYTSAATDTMDVAPSSTDGDTYTFSIPAADDGAFVTYWVAATDDTGATSTSDPLSYRVLLDGINEVEDLQLTASGGSGGGPFTGLTTAMDLTVTVQTRPGVSGLMAVQDSEDPWSGVIILGSSDFDGLQRGDVIHITEATIQENFSLTRLRDITFDVVSQGGDGIPYKLMTTDALQDAAVAEAHEGMALRFENITITSTNPDGSASNGCDTDHPEYGFGEWAFSSDGTPENALRADDESTQIPCGLNLTAFDEGEVAAYIQGILTYTFSNYKLLPETVENDVHTAVEDETVPGTFALRQNYPNPFNPATTIEYTLPATGRVRLEVFDVLGRVVAVLVDREEAVGTHSVPFDASSLASGLYLYRLTSGDKVETMKMMLLK